MHWWKIRQRDRLQSYSKSRLNTIGLLNSWDSSLLKIMDLSSIMLLDKLIKTIGEVSMCRHLLLLSSNMELTLAEINSKLSAGKLELEIKHFSAINKLWGLSLPSNLLISQLIAKKAIFKGLWTISLSRSSCLTLTPLLLTHNFNLPKLEQVFKKCFSNSEIQRLRGLIWVRTTSMIKITIMSWDNTRQHSLIQIKT